MSFEGTFTNIVRRRYQLTASAQPTNNHIVRTQSSFVPLNLITLFFIIMLFQQHVPNVMMVYILHYGSTHHHHSPNKSTGEHFHSTIIVVEMSVICNYQQIDVLQIPAFFYVFQTSSFWRHCPCHIC